MEILFTVDFLCQKRAGLLTGEVETVVVVLDVVDDGGGVATRVGVCILLLSLLRMVFVLVSESSVTLT